ncbi:ATP-binding protein [Rhizocola hellebori]|uniref:ATP-binding protein n=1 Tax=Rhizocola hellebori TaxID=1392758 RepID=UPI001940B907|nr:tetratricopeptide repeat protein [Rhizocola hellebori]
MAREVRISRAQLYAVLNGEIKRPPDFETLVRPLIRACGGTDAELAEWRRRHEVLVAVHVELRRQRVAPREAARPGAAEPRTSPPAQLPANVEVFVGRASELSALDAVTTRVVTITGTAGVGKTALAVHWAHRASSGFADGQLYVNLRGFDGNNEAVDPADAIRGFLDAFGVEPQRVPANRDAQAALYRSLSASRRMLVILDNARDADQVRPLLAGGPAVHTVITSRNRLTSLVAEIGAHPLILGLPDQAEATELLNSRIGAPSHDEDATGAIVAACGRLPLALCLVAARIRQTRFPLATLAAELRRPGTDALDEIQAVFSWSYSALSPSAARMLRLLGLTAGADIATEAVAALTGVSFQEAHKTLRELTDASVLTEHTPGRFELHDPLRTYAGELARETDSEEDRRAALTRLLDHYTYTAHEADRVLNPTRAPIPMALDASAEGARPIALDTKSALVWLGTERAALMSALHQAREAGLDRHAWQLGWALDTFLFEQHHWQDEGTAWAIALAAATALMDRSAAAHAHRFLGVVAGRLERFGEAHAHMSRAAEMCRAAGDLPGQAETEFVLSYVRWLQQDRNQALAHAERSLELWAQLDHPNWEGKASNAVGLYHSAMGAHRQALPYYERAVALQQQAGDRANETVARDGLGQAYHHLGYHEAAVDQYEHGLRLARALADPILEAQLTSHLGDTYEAVGDASSAQECWEKAHKMLVNAGHPQASDVARKLQVTDPR